MDNFSIQYHLTLKEYRKIYFILLYSKLWVILISAFSVLFIIASCILYHKNNQSILNSDYYFYAMVIAVIPIWIPIASLFTVWRGYKTAHSINEQITYDFSNEGYISTGESFTCTTKWTKIYKVKILKGWLILYHNRFAANMIKVGTADEENIELLKKFLKSENLRAKLKW